MKDLTFTIKHLTKKLKPSREESAVVRRHNVLREKYKTRPELARIVDYAVVVGKHFDDPFHTSVEMNHELSMPLKTGLHRAVGGDHDLPNPGDILCAALAACMESTIRMIANRLDIRLSYTKVEVEAYVDVHGTLMFDKSVPVGFQNLHIEVKLGAVNTGEKTLKTLFNAAKRSCVVYQTLKPGVAITKNLTIIME